MTSDSDDALTWDGDEGAPPPRTSSKGRTSSGRRPQASTEDADGTSPPTPRPPVAKTGGATSTVGAAAHDERNDVAGGDHDAAEREPLSTAMLLAVGVVGGIYLLYSIGWVVGGLRLKPLANFFVTDAMFVPWFVLAVAAPALWFLASWLLTRGRASWIRICLLLLGIVLLVPWPFVTVGVIGS